ncbi:MAG: ABC transporter permease [Alphaproteobacteria bacterium]|nr:ABC transporter permease [Alphaproteobacteria bacterium]MBU1552058.1 ABC transporter permease [Alphaproteobacteria bacterium]MBU2337668.1 ABC transporter permease [Alphaproteobacteria bacterium]MBU2391508.1 ABC transporter permease [Alphaproteobacteria bacterium]
MTEVLQIFVGGILLGAIYALIALGFSLIYRVTGVVNLSQGGFAVVAALAGYTFSQQLGMPLPIALVCAVGGTALAGLAVGWFTFVPALKKLSNANVLMLTVGILTLIEGFSLIIWGSQPYSVPAFSGEQPLEFFGLRITTQTFWILGTSLTVFVLLWLLISRTKVGKALRACSENPSAAALMGINVKRMTVLSFTLATLIAATAGVVVAPTTTLQFNTGQLFTISGFIAVVIGGISSFPGAIVGGLFLGLVTQFATAYVSSLFSNAIALILLLFILIYAPTGLVPSKVNRRQDVREEPRVWGHLTRLAPRTAWIAAVIGLTIAIMLPLIVPKAYISSLTIAAIIFLALIGLDLLMGYTGQVSLGQAGFMAIGGYTAGYLSIHYELEPVLGIAAGMALSLLSALVLSVVTLRLRGLYLALATLAFGLLVDSCAIGFIDITGGPSGMVGIPSFSVGAWSFDTPISMYFLVMVIDVVVLFALFGALRSSFGRALQSIRSDQMAAGALGINIVRYKLAAFMISAALASLAGSLLAYSFNFLAPEMVGTARSLEMVSMLVIGGEGTLVGPLFGSVLLTMLPTIFQPLAVYKTFFSGALLIICFLYLPRGMYGVIATVMSRMSHGETAAKGQKLAEGGAR